MSESALIIQLQSPSGDWIDVGLLHNKDEHNWFKFTEPKPPSVSKSASALVIGAPVWDSSFHSIANGSGRFEVLAVRVVEPVAVFSVNGGR